MPDAECRMLDVVAKRNSLVIKLFSPEEPGGIVKGVYLFSTDSVGLTGQGHKGP